MKVTRNKLIHTVIDPLTSDFVLLTQVKASHSKATKNMFHTLYNALPKWLRNHLISADENQCGIRLWGKIGQYYQRHQFSFVDGKQKKNTVVNMHVYPAKAQRTTSNSAPVEK